MSYKKNRKNIRNQLSYMGIVGFNIIFIVFHFAVIKNVVLLGRKAD